jgi:hypothetical protein
LVANKPIQASSHGYLGLFGSPILGDPVLLVVRYAESIGRGHAKQVHSSRPAGVGLIRRRQQPIDTDHHGEYDNQ